MTRPLTLARTAGALYLLLAVLGAWAQLVARGSIYVPGDAAATAAGIVEHETLFRLSLAADILMAVVFVLLGLTLFRLLDDVERRAGTALLVFVAVGAGSILINLTFQVGALLTATSSAFDAGTTLLLLDLHSYGYALGGVFFGLWLLPMGWAAVRTSLFPTWLGVLLITGAAAWVADPVILFALPDAEGALRGVTAAVTTVAELTLVVYLLVRGVSREAPVPQPALSR
ncbi:DUF4386 domain-containing protein [Cellulomonas sp. Leaf334]|uniref:DUF4386 domain-containing protein n=1 Tax=Cellulomonas sp. Leaf334 TaxID=1736339 RepID=UPI0006FA4129|nr:DUF4386 domain-containing protein [Cellulomonas sp. Leaf334]KQR17168.1 hypothetical protein ASF78_07635 [Cellulomonas sp. Leaf334]